MSGGSFNYAYSKVDYFADELEARLDGEREKGIEWSKEVAEELRKVVKEARRMAELMHAVEWMYSGDYGDDTFLEVAKKHNE